MPVVVLPAPAKINLVLEILGRRPDGFHALETVFQTLELADTLTIAVEPGAGISLTITGAELSTGPDNLAWRAAAAYLERHPLGRVSLLLHKRVPHGAGLGGGSSDAATVLRGLVMLDPDPLTDLELAAIALAIGSDVPFFLIGGTAHAVGRGEILSPLMDAPLLPVTILKPVEGCPTPAVFKAMTEAERGPRHPRGPAWFAHRLTTAGINDLLLNRMTAAAIRVTPAVGDLLTWLEQARIPHLMSGSGSACFALGHLDPLPGISAWRTAFRPRALLNLIGEPDRAGS